MVWENKGTVQGTDHGGANLGPNVEPFSNTDAPTDCPNFHPHDKPVVRVTDDKPVTLRILQLRACCARLQLQGM